MKYIKTYKKLKEKLQVNEQQLQEDLISSITFDQHKFNDLLSYFIDCNYSLNFIDDNNFTPLTAAVYYDRLEAIKVLLRNGADINYADDDGSTPLIVAAINNKIDIIIFLIKSGADWNLSDTDDKDFIDYLYEDYMDIIIEDYPEKYKNYLAWKDAKKYNL